MYSNFGTALTIFSLSLAHLAWGQALEQYPLKPAGRHIDIDKLGGRRNFTRDSYFNFNINRNQFSDHLTVQETIDGPKFYGSVNGEVNLVRGSASQNYSFEILVRVSSETSGEAVDSIVIDAHDYGLNIRSIAPPLPPGGHRPDVTVTVVIFVRPGSVQAGTTNIRTRLLGIRLWEALSFDAKNMNLLSIYGSIRSSELFYFTARQIRIETEYGAIHGSWSLPNSIELRSVHAPIDIDLVPKRWSYGPWTPGDLRVSTETGSIDVRMPFAADKLSMRNSTMEISTSTGSIRVDLVHGALTTLKSTYGSVNATLLPYWAFSESRGVQFNHITTECQHGATHVDVLPPIVDSYYKIQPLCFAKSRHVQGSGHLELRYPREWCGTAVGTARHGAVRVSGEDFEVIEKTRSRVVVQRRPLGSDLYFETKYGSAELIMKNGV